MKVICELREKYSLSLLLKIAGISKSTYSYAKNHLDYKAQKDEPLLDEIRRIFKENGCKYGYPRITLDVFSDDVYYGTLYTTQRNYESQSGGVIVFDYSISLSGSSYHDPIIGR